jgi:hypothetical protein
MRSNFVPATTPPWTVNRWGRLGILFIFVCAGYLFTRAHMLLNLQYLNISRYISGNERLPYQRRLLPMLILRALARIPVPQRVVTILGQHHSLYSQLDYVYLFIIDFVAVALASYFCIKLYRAASVYGRLSFIVYPVLIFTLTWTYNNNTLLGVYFPYDLLGVAVFSAGLFYIYTGRFVSLVVVMFIGSLNRETTAFFVPLFLFNEAHPSITQCVRLRGVVWIKAIFLGSIWLAVRLILRQFFVSNDASDAILHARYNLSYFPPTYWPELVSGCGFLLVAVWCLRRRIPNARIARYMYVVPLWVATMYCWGIMIETRIYGELCPLVTVASVLLLESYLGKSLSTSSADAVGVCELES